MPNFSYIATDSKGGTVNGIIDQADRSAVIAALTKQNLRPVSIKEASEKKGIKLDFGKFLTQNKVKSDQLVIFTRQLSAMVGAGVPLLRALTSLTGHLDDSPALKKILLLAIADIEAGSTLGDALAKYPDTFNDVYVNMVRAGEAAGILDDILKRLAMQQEKNTTIRKKVRSAMTYPIVLICITILAFFGLMFFVIPQIGNILTDLGGPDAELPGITLFMLGVSHFISSFWYVIFIVIGGGVYAITRYVKTPRGRHLFHMFVLKVPALNAIIKKIAVARFARTFSALMGAGVAVLEALNVTAHSLGNAIFEESLIQAAEEVKNGKSLSKIIGANPLFPPIVSQMLLVGEETGQTDTVLVKVADFYEEEVDVAIEGVSSIIEPVMIVMMGGMVGLIAASVMVPIAGLAQSIK